MPDHLHLVRLKERRTCAGGTFDADYIVSQAYTVTFTLGGEAREITVPEGMVTDLASVPWWARWFAGQVGPHLEAAIVHDHLYIAWIDVERGVRAEDRRFADDLMFAIMRGSGMPVWAAWVIWAAVRIGGAAPYSDKGGEIRYLRPLGETLEVAA
ncbi:MAG: DUF1353 domain-containing protein [Pseudomonadota bacterium]